MLLTIVAGVGLLALFVGQALQATLHAREKPTADALFRVVEALGPRDGGTKWDGPVTRWDGIGTVKGARPPATRNGEAFFSSPLRVPYYVTDRFGVPRGDDVVHGGIDLALTPGSHAPVYSACVGHVTAADNSETYGNYVVVDCGTGWSTVYGHFSELLAAPGDRVDTGTVLGLSGSTGYSTGEHLHFEIRLQGLAYDPERFLGFE